MLIFEQSAGLNSKDYWVGLVKLTPSFWSILWYSVFIKSSVNQFSCSAVFDGSAQGVSACIHWGSSIGRGHLGIHWVHIGDRIPLRTHWGASSRNFSRPQLVKLFIHPTPAHVPSCLPWWWPVYSLGWAFHWRAPGKARLRTHLGLLALGRYFSRLSVGIPTWT